MTTVTEPPPVAPRAEAEGLQPAPTTDAPSDVAVKVADFAELSGAATSTATTPLDSLLNVTVTVTVELGRTTVSIGEILKLGVGSVLELDRAVFEPVDLMAQGVRLARGEVVVVDDRFAIRIKEITDPKKRV